MVIEPPLSWGYGQGMSAFRHRTVKNCAVDRSARHSTAGGVALPYRLGRRRRGIRCRHCPELSVNRNTVILWRKRFADEGLDGLWDIAPGRGRKPRYSIDKIAAIVDATLQTKPAGRTHCSCRTMAHSQGVSKSTVNNIWRAHNLQPHRTKTFELSRDPKFLEKMTDVVGLYLNPPQQAIVLCVDEKSQIQALDRTQPGLPIKPGRCGNHDPRLQTQRHHHSLRCSGDITGQGRRRGP